MPHHAPAPAPNAFMDMVRAQQSFDLDRIEAEQRMKAHKAMAEGKQREKEALQTAVKNALAKRDTAKQTWERLHRDNDIQDENNVKKREGMLRLTNIVDVSAKESIRNESDHNMQIAKLEAQCREHTTETCEQARRLCLALKVNTDDPRVAKKDGVLVEAGGQCLGYLPLPTTSATEVEAAETRVAQLQEHLREQTEALATVQAQLRAVEDERAGLQRSEEEKDMDRLLTTACEEVARLQAELEAKRAQERGAEKGGEAEEEEELLQETLPVPLMEAEETEYERVEEEGGGMADA